MYSFVDQSGAALTITLAAEVSSHGQHVVPCKESFTAAAATYCCWLILAARARLYAGVDDARRYNQMHAEGCPSRPEWDAARLPDAVPEVTLSCRTDTRWMALTQPHFAFTPCNAGCRRLAGIRRITETFGSRSH